MSESNTEAWGAPGISPRWTTSDKSGVGTALSPLSRVWFTISHGILNECYYPRVDQACTRDLGLLVTDGASFFAEEKRDADSLVSTIADGVPAYCLTNTHRPADGSKPRFRLRKWIITDPERDVVLQKLTLETLWGPRLRLFALLAPHLVNGGANNIGWRDQYKGQTMLFATGDGRAVALAASRPYVATSVGYAGSSDGWQDLSQHYELRWRFERAGPGNIALAAELDPDETGTIVLALGFGGAPNEAAFRARASLDHPFDGVMARYASAWRNWQLPLRPLDRTNRGHNTYRVSTAVMRAHEAPSFPGGFIASLSIPWGATKGDDDLGGYHLVWPRDLVETAGGLIAAGANEDAVRVLSYLRTIQEPDGHWNQNTWLDGIPYWGGVQMDECAFPILLADLALREGALSEASLRDYWPMLRAAASFVVRQGPVTAQDRWEENGGFNTFTLAVEIAALVVAADLAQRLGEGEIARFLLDTADAWHASLDDWVYAQGTELARRLGIDGYYLRLAPDRPPGADSGKDTPIMVKNRPDGQSTMPAHDLVSLDALALVRFGLRAADDPRMLGTIAAVDDQTRRDLPVGPLWYRYNQDGYGEHPDGSAFDGTGIGRLWPLLTGERAHYALAAGNRAEAEALLATMEACASRGALLPEQVWDQDDIPARELCRGRPSGSAMPLVWAHAEHVKLLRSLAEERVFDTPPQTVQRFLRESHKPRVQPWRPGFEPSNLPRGRSLRITLPSASIIHWSDNDWASSQETPTTPSGLGLHVMEWTPSDAGAEPRPAAFVFTWRDASSGAWIGRNVTLAIEA